MKTPYTDRIAALSPGHDPRHVEAYMRVGHHTLDGLSAPSFRAEVALVCLCVEAEGPARAEQVAASFGL